MKKEESRCKTNKDRQIKKKKPGKEEENPWEKRTKRPDTDKNGKATKENEEKRKKMKKNLGERTKNDGKRRKTWTK